MTTLDMLCRIAIEAYQSTGASIFPPKSPEDTSQPILDVVRDIFLLLQEYGIGSMTPKRLRLLSTASDLAVLLLSCVRDISQMPIAQAAMHYNYAEDLRQDPNISQELQRFLQNYALSLSMLVGNANRPVMGPQQMGPAQYVEEEHSVEANLPSAARLSINWYLTQAVRINARHNSVELIMP